MNSGEDGMRRGGLVLLNRLWMLEMEMKKKKITTVGALLATCTTLSMADGRDSGIHSGMVH